MTTRENGHERSAMRWSAAMRLSAEQLLEAVCAQPSLNLDAVTASAPGLYLLFHDPAAGPRLYEPLEDWPIYVGSTVELRSRMRRHLGTLRAADDLAPEAFSVVVLPCDRMADASFAEHTLVEVIGNVIWNQRWLAGFGSRVPGRHRRGDRSPWDHLHPGRAYWTRPHDASQRAALVERVHEFLDGEGRPRARWRDANPQQLQQRPTPSGVADAGNGRGPRGR